MCTSRANSIQASRLTYEQNGLVTDMPAQHLAVSKPVQRNTLTEVGVI